MPTSCYQCQLATTMEFGKVWLMLTKMWFVEESQKHKLPLPPVVSKVGAGTSTHAIIM